MELMITAIAGFSILLGALATHLIKDTEKMEHLSMALALGALAALLLFDLFPEVHELVEAQGWGYSLGMLVVGIAMLKDAKAKTFLSGTGAMRCFASQPTSSSEMPPISESFRRWR